MSKILALIGDFYHPADYLKKGLADIFADREAEISFVEDGIAVSWSKLSQYDVFILAKSGQVAPQESDEIWITEKHLEYLTGYVKNGGKLLVLHSGLAGYPDEGHYRELVRGNFIQHPEGQPEVKISVVGKEHVVTNGVKDFRINDEHYFVEYDKEQTDTLLRADSRHGHSPAGWLHQYGQGLVFSLTPGHTLEVLKEPMMKRLILNFAKS